MGRFTRLVWRRSETPEELLELLETLGEEYPMVEGGRGVKLKFRRIQSAETVSNVIRSKGEALIEYSSISAASRGIGSVLSGLQGRESTPFKTLGIMLDVSRNMVMKVDHLKRWLRRLALSGYNLTMLYTEDIYQLPSEPFFGYMRGGYSLEEIKAIDLYAKRLGIELVGCIQTLGHLEQILRWRGAYGQIRDTASVLIVDEVATYKLIDKMIAFWSEALSSRRIHVGMDETHDLGRGKFIDQNGFEAPFELFNRHLGKVNSLCQKHGMAPQIWSDMYFRLSNPKQEYYDFTSEIPKSVQKHIPKNVQLVYWDYYHEDRESYEKMINRHRQIGFEPVMASGIWTWTRMWYDHEKTKSTVVPCIEACRKLKVKELFFTMWGDDGAYCNYDSALAGLVYSADLAFGVKSDEDKLTATRFATICGSNLQANIVASGIQAQLSVGDCKYSPNPALLIWDDPLLGIYFDEFARRDPDFVMNIIDHYEDTLRRLLPYQDDKMAGDFEHILNALDLLIQKIGMRSVLVDAYLAGDRITLRQVAVSMIPAVIAAVQEFDSSFRAQWLDCAKPFGLETIQIRNAGLMARLEETALRIREYLDGEISVIEELEVGIIPGDTTNNPNRYTMVCSGSSIH